MVGIAPVKNPLVLDVATGTARLPLALLRHRRFRAHRRRRPERRMPSHAAYKLGGDRRVTPIWSPAERLPFGDATFDVVSASKRSNSWSTSAPCCAKSRACCDRAACC
ncbi:MAG: class I SAM-dependent methyltransferase [Anaerolineae bacterium]